MWSILRFVWLSLFLAACSFGPKVEFELIEGAKCDSANNVTKSPDKMCRVIVVNCTLTSDETGYTYNLANGRFNGQRVKYSLHEEQEICVPNENLREKMEERYFMSIVKIITDLQACITSKEMGQKAKVGCVRAIEERFSPSLRRDGHMISDEERAEEKRKRKN